MNQGENTPLSPRHRQWSTRALRYFHYLGLLFAVFMLIEARRSTHETDETLSQSVYQQQNLRNILWMNLLIQRSTGLALTGNQVKDNDYLTRSKIIADSIEEHAGNISAKPEVGSSTGIRDIVQKNGTEFRGTLEKYLAKQENASQLSVTVDRIGAELNRIESEEWYHLNEHNVKLLRDIKKDHLVLMIMLGIFVSYLAMLGWILRRKEKAEAALLNAEAKMLTTAKISALGEMAGGVAHEINNPLATIGLLTEQARELLEEKSGENAVVIEMLQKVSKTVTRISSIVQGLRTFSRDGSRDQFENIRARSVLENTLSLCQEKFKNSGVTVSIEIAPEDLTITCRQVQISQVLLNLFNNSCDAISQLPEKWIKISAEKKGQLIVLAVTDSGSGIPESVNNKIFSPFFTTKEIGKGTGLGLSVSKGIIDAHKGKIYLDRSCPNTRFLIELPIPPPAPTNPKKKPHMPAN